MLTTPEEPSQCVGHLQYRNVKFASILTGHYRLKHDRVTVIVQKQEQQQKNHPYRRNKRIDTYDSGQQTFHLVCTEKNLSILDKI